MPPHCRTIAGLTPLHFSPPGMHRKGLSGCLPVMQRLELPPIRASACPLPFPEDPPELSLRVGQRKAGTAREVRTLFLETFKACLALFHGLFGGSFLQGFKAHWCQRKSPLRVHVGRISTISGAGSQEFRTPPDPPFPHSPSHGHLYNLPAPQPVSVSLCSSLRKNTSSF